MAMPLESETRIPVNGKELLPEIAIKQEILSMTVPSVELQALVAPGRDGKSRFPVVIGKSEWAPVLGEVARLNADTQFSLGVARHFYPLGLVRDGIFIYSFDPKNTVVEALALGQKVETRKYKFSKFTPDETTVNSLFPESQSIRSLIGDIQEMASGPLASLEDSKENDKGVKTQSETTKGIAKRTANFIFKKLTNREPHGPLNLSAIYGLPVLRLHSPQDLQELQPYQFVDLSPETQAFSYVVNRYTNRVISKGTLSGFPLVVCLEDCPEELIRRHMYTQLLFASVAKPEAVSPILISQDPKSKLSQLTPAEKFEQVLENKIKDGWLLKGVIAERQPVDWMVDPKDEKTGRFLNARARELFLQRKGQHSDLFIGDWLGMGYDDEESRIAQAVKDGVWELAASKLESGARVLGNMVSLLPSIEYQLVIANYLSMFPVSRWPEAQALLADYEISTGGKFRKSFNIFPLRHNDIKKEIPEDDETLQQVTNSPTILTKPLTSPDSA